MNLPPTTPLFLQLKLLQIKRKNVLHQFRAIVVKDGTKSQTIPPRTSEVIDLQVLERPRSWHVGSLPIPRHNRPAPVKQILAGGRQVQGGRLLDLCRRLACSVGRDDGDGRGPFNNLNGRAPLSGHFRLGSTLVPEWIRKVGVWGEARGQCRA